MSNSPRVRRVMGGTLVVTYYDKPHPQAHRLVLAPDYEGLRAVVAAHALLRYLRRLAAAKRAEDKLEARHVMELTGINLSAVQATRPAQRPFRLTVYELLDDGKALARDPVLIPAGTVREVALIDTMMLTVRTS